MSRKKIKSGRGLLGTLADPTLSIASPTEPEQIKTKISDEKAKLYRNIVELIRKQSDIQHIEYKEFFNLFENLRLRLEIRNDEDPFIMLWRFTSALLADQPEFKRPAHRPSKKGGGLPYDRYLAVMEYKAEHGEAMKTSVAIRALIKSNHRLFAGYSEETMTKEVSKGKGIAKRLALALALLQHG